MKNFKIDIVEDSPVVASLLAREFNKKKNVQVQIFESGERYLAQHRECDLVIMDYYHLKFINQ